MSDKTFSEDAIEQFDAALSAARSDLAAAERCLESARQAQQNRHFRPALASYDEALPLYRAVLSRLQALAELADPLPMALIRKQRATAIELRAAANQQINDIGGPGLRQMCQTQAQEAERLIREAREAAHNNQFQLAHDYAREAEQEDASFADEVARLRREIPDHEDSGRGKLVGCLVALAVVGALLWFVGLPQIRRVWAELNPPPVAALATPTLPPPTATPLASQIQPTPAPVAATAKADVSVGSEASTTALPVFTLAAGESVLITRFIGAPDQPVWLEIERANQRGWVAAASLTFAGPLPAALQEK